MKWTAQQDTALTAVSEWLRSGEATQRHFFLAGFAGTGKTTLAKHLASDVDNVIFAAYTGKAAHVMNAAGCVGARTLHSLIYCPKEKSRKRLRELEKGLSETLSIIEYERLKHLILEEKNNLARPSFTLNHESRLRGADLLVVDECSMVNEAMAKDILSFDAPVLVLGDPFQLPPVRGGGWFTNAEPDIMLTDVQRTARDNPIIDMATLIREGHGVRYGSYGASSVIPVSNFDRDAIDIDTQVIVGKNATRRRANLRMRGNLMNAPDPWASVLINEQIVCLRNSKECRILNGELFRVADIGFGAEDDIIDLVIQSEDDPDEVREVSAGSTTSRDGARNSTTSGAGGWRRRSSITATR